jgi:hypothetical protein
VFDGAKIQFFFLSTKGIGRKMQRLSSSFFFFGESYRPPTVVAAGRVRAARALLTQNSVRLLQTPI